MERRQFLKHSSAATASLALPMAFALASVTAEPRYHLSLGQWTFTDRAFRGVEGVAKRDALEFPTMAGELGFEGVD